MKRQSLGICADCVKLHKRMQGGERLERRDVLTATLASMRASETAFDYALRLYDHLTLAPKSRTPGPRYHPAPAPPATWTAVQLDRVDRIVLTTLHLWRRERPPTVKGVPPR